MAAITASMVGELRAKTDAPMMECKKALTEADGNMEKAEELLRIKLGNKAGKASSRITAEGVVAAYVEGTTGGLIEINCETDFVSKNDSFLAFANKAAELVAKNNPADLAALGALPYEQDGFGPTLEDVRKGLIGKIGENMTFRRFKRFASGAKLASYLHGTRIGVLVEYEGDDVAAKDVAMHIAAMKPVALSTADVSNDLIEKERAVAAGKAEEDRKAAEAAGKPVQSAEIVAKRCCMATKGTRTGGGEGRVLYSLGFADCALRQFKACAQAAGNVSANRPTQGVASRANAGGAQKRAGF